MLTLDLLASPPWSDYELIDSGGSQKLERFGQYTLVRPEPQALWSPGLSPREWAAADARFERGRDGDGAGEWVQKRVLPEQWLMQHDTLSFWARPTPFRHTGVFPEHSAHWKKLGQKLTDNEYQPNVLVLFGYTGLSTLYAAHVGARVCHVDASRPAVRWARNNQEASGLDDKPIRWIVDDVTKFVAREARRGVRYDLIMMDPPVFGRGPNGEVWRLNEALPELVRATAELLSDKPLGVVVNAYATNVSSVTLYNVLAEAMHEYDGTLSAGELVLRETATARLLPLALYACWYCS